MFNVQGSELIFLLLIALVVLGPEKLPDAVRKATKAYAELKKMVSGFQGEFREVLDEPMRELRGTADAIRSAAKFDMDLDLGLDGKGSPASQHDTVPTGAVDPPRSAPPVQREAGLNFGSANPRRQNRVAGTGEAAGGSNNGGDNAAATVTEPAPSEPATPAPVPEDMAAGAGQAAAAEDPHA